MIAFQPIDEDGLAELLEEIPGGLEQAAFSITIASHAVRLVVRRRSPRTDAVLRMLIDFGLDHSSVQVHDR